MSVEIHTDEQLADSPVLQAVFGEALPKIEVFHGKLQAEGEERGLIGPRDVDIIWERHLLNSAAIVPFVAEKTEGRQFKTVADLGSGGGFPGLVIAAMLADRMVTLIEPMERRIEWLNECVDAMELANVKVVRGRAEEAIASLRMHNGQGRGKVAVTDDMYQAITHPFAVVTCRAVAPMGALVALKGRSAQAEIDKAKPMIKRFGGIKPRVVTAPVADGFESTQVVIVDKR